MLLAIISDTHLPHGRRRLPESCVDRLRGVELILHAGDISGAIALDQLRRIGPPVRAVCGNVDEPALQELLPNSISLVLEGVRVAMIHDAGPARGRLRRMRARFPDADVVIFGHSHIPLHEEEGGLQLFNPGSPTERRRSPERTMGIARLDGGLASLEHVVV
jgi:putative phosphoesterase